MAKAQINVTMDAALLLETLKYARQKSADLKTFRFSLWRVRQNAVINFLDIMIEEFDAPATLTINGDD